MKRKTIITSGNSSHLTSHMLSRISRRIRKKATSGINVIAPDIDFLNSLKSRMIIEEGIDGFQDDIFKTFHGLASEINPEINLASVSMLRLILKNVLFYPGSRLKSEGRMPGFRRILFKLFEEFMSTDDAVREDLLNAIMISYPDGASEKGMMIKIIEIFSTYENELAKRKLDTRDSALVKAIRTIGTKNHFGDVFILGFSEFTPTEASLIDSLAQFTDSIAIAMTEFGDQNSRKMDETIAGFVEAGFVKLNLFADEVTPATRLLTVNTNRGEAEYIAKKTCELIESGFSPEDILIVHPKAGSAVAVFKSTFDRLRIPFRSSLPVPLKSVSPVRDILAILGILNEDTENMMSLLSGRFGIKISSALKHLDNKTIKLLIQDEGVDKPGDVEIESWSLVKALFAKANRVSSFDDFKRLIHFISKECIRIPEYLPTEISSTAPKAMDTFFSLLDEFSNFADMFDSYMTSERKYSTYLFSLKEQVESSLVRPRDDRKDAVEFTGLDNVLMKKADVLFLAGMSDVNFPTRSLPDPLLGEQARNELTKPGYMLNTAQDDLEKELFLFNAALSLPGKKLFISSPTRDDRSEEIEISPALRKLYFTGWEKADDEKWLIFNRDDLITETALLMEDESTRETGEVLLKALADSHPRGARILLDRESESAELSSENANLISKNITHFSATALARYTQCPFLYFAENVLNLPSAQTSLEQIFNPLVRGSVIHKYLSYRIAAKAEHVSMLEILSEEGINLKDFEITDDVVLSDYLVFLEKFIDEELARIREQDRKIIRTERPFGMMDYPDFKMEFDGKEWRFRGIIDRIDQLSDGTFAVVDYKITNAKASKLFEDASKFQLPLYAMALMAEKMMPAVMEIVAVGRNEWDCKSTLDSKPDEIQFDDLISQGRDNIFQVLDSVIHGRFLAEPTIPDYCGWDSCGYYHVCRIDR